MCLCMHTLASRFPWWRLRKKLLTSKNACGFLILIPHTEVTKQWTAESHDLLPERFSDDPTARCLHAAVWHGCVCIPCRPCISLKGTQASPNFTHKTCFLLWGSGLLVSCLCERLFKDFGLKWSCERKRRAAWRGGDTRHFLSHYIVTHPLPAS